MAVVTDFVERSTRGICDIHDITHDVEQCIQRSELAAGTVTVFVSGSTAGLTTVEFEPGLRKDLPEFFEKIIPSNKTYHHDATWGDGNGFSHVRASLLGPSLVIPFSERRILLGTWQQVILVDFDNRPRNRKIIVQIMGE